MDIVVFVVLFFFFQAEDGIRDAQESRGLGDVYKRQVLEETGLVVEVTSLVGIYSDPRRDPRGHVVSAAFAAVIVSGELASGSDAAEANFWEITHLPPLAFDHAQIVRDALRRR